MNNEKKSITKLDHVLIIIIYTPQTIYGNSFTRWKVYFHFQPILTFVYNYIVFDLIEKFSKK